MAEITLMRTPAETKLGEQFRALAPGRDADRRRAAFERFSSAGLPHRRIEAWHYTDLRSLLREPFQPAAAVPAAEVLRQAEAALPPAPGARRLVLVDGAFAPALSQLDGLPAGVTIGAAGAATGALAAATALGKAESVLALNEAFAPEGVAITLAGGASLPERLDVIHVVTGGAAKAVSSRVLVELGDHASLTLVERFLAPAGVDVQGNHAMVAALGDGATLDHAGVVVGLSEGSIHLGSSLVRLGADARFTSFALAATPGLTRRQTFAEFAGEHSAVSLNGVSLLDGRAHADTTLVVTHAAPHCESREYFKTILAGASTGVYQGKVVVAPGAQKTDGKMLSKAVFLDDGASMFNKPELEIFADDVVCGHGATVGYLDEEQLFYLRSRGIPRKQAQAMLLNAFAADALESVADEALRDDLTESVEAWLSRRQG